MTPGHGRGPLFGTIACLALIAACGAETRAIAEQPNLELGRKELKERCARCHALGTDDSSSHADAPPFRDVVKRYPAEYLAEALAEGIVSGHPDMPIFELSPEEIEAVIIYLQSLTR
jgi:cytochrome c